MLPRMDQTTTSFFCPGVPKPQGSKNVSRTGHTYEANPDLPAWRAKVTQVARLHHKGAPLDMPVRVTAVFVMPRPKRPKWDYPAGPPDCDKLQRAVGDALEQAGVVRNDSRIVAWSPLKRYPEEGEDTGVYVKVEPMT